MEHNFLKIKGTEFSMGIITHPFKSNSIIINLPGFGGSINGYDDKYVKLANYITDRKLAAVVRMPNVLIPSTNYAYILLNALRSTIEYAISNAELICGTTTPDIYLMGTSAGGGAVSFVAHEYPQIKKILLICPAGGNVSTAGNCYKQLAKFTGDIYITIGVNDEVVGVKSGLNFFNAAFGIHKNRINVSLVEIPNCDHHFTGERNGRILSMTPFWAFGNEHEYPHVTDSNSYKLYDDLLIDKTI